MPMLFLVLMDILQYHHIFPKSIKEPQTKPKIRAPNPVIPTKLAITMITISPKDRCEGEYFPIILLQLGHV